MKKHIAKNDGETFSFAATFVDELKLDPKFKVVVGIDVGTTYSGISYVARQNPKKVNCGAPSAKNARDETKVPTVLLRRPDNTWAFGNDALEEHRKLVDNAWEDSAKDGLTFSDSVTPILKREGVALFRDYKMELKDKTTGFNQLTAVTTLGVRHSLLDLMSKTLHFLSDFALEEIQDGWLRAFNVTKSDVLWVLTVPAIWNDFGKAFMRKAAFKCGMIAEEGSDHLLLALEPESAALAVHGEGSEYGLLTKNNSFLMLDIGGGTADFTLHKVSNEKPLLLQEVVKPTGGPWGGIYVDSEFKAFLKRLIGKEKFALLEQYQSVELDEIGDAFRALKEDFDPYKMTSGGSISLGSLFGHGIVNDLGIPSLLELVVEYNSQFANGPTFDLSRNRTKRQIKEQFKLTFSYEQMLQFFEPTLSLICSCVRKLAFDHKETNMFAIVGGYGSSKVLRQRIKKEFEGPPFYKQVVTPDAIVRPQTAIVHGAAYFGLYTSVIGTRITKYTYGVAVNEAFFHGCRYKAEEAAFDSRLQQMRVPNVFSLIVPGGTSVSPDQKFTPCNGYAPIYPDQTTVCFRVYRSEYRNPRLTKELGCVKVGSVDIPCRSFQDRFDVTLTFGSEIRVTVVRMDGEIRSTTISLED